MAMAFLATIRYWRPERAGGLAVVDVPSDVAQALGGLKQLRVNGTINGQDFVSNTMPAGGGTLALSVSKAMMSSAGATVGDAATFEIRGKATA